MLLLVSGFQKRLYKLKLSFMSMDHGYDSLVENLKVATAVRPLETSQHTVRGRRLPPSLPSFSINRYKKIEADAFRPTSSGHSPGVGHFQPPTA